MATPTDAQARLLEQLQAAPADLRSRTFPTYLGAECYYSGWMDLAPAPGGVVWVATNPDGRAALAAMKEEQA